MMKFNNYKNKIWILKNSVTYCAYTGFIGRGKNGLT